MDWQYEIDIDIDDTTSNSDAMPGPIDIGGDSKSHILVPQTRWGDDMR